MGYDIYYKEPLVPTIELELEYRKARDAYTASDDDEKLMNAWLSAGNRLEDAQGYWRSTIS